MLTQVSLKDNQAGLLCQWCLSARSSTSSIGHWCCPKPTMAASSFKKAIPWLLAPINGLSFALFQFQVPPFNNPQPLGLATALQPRSGCRSTTLCGSLQWPLLWRRSKSQTQNLGFGALKSIIKIIIINKVNQTCKKHNPICWLSFSIHWTCTSLKSTWRAYY